jgi:nucleoside-diphosphate-sugar epimerase
VYTNTEENMNNTTILVTGSNGYLGTVISQLLVAHEFNVIGIDNYMRPMSDFGFYLNRFPNFAFRKMDIRDPKIKDLLKNVDFIVHTAALSGEPLCAANPSEAWSVNYDGAYNLLNSKPTDCGFIFHSTGSVYGKIDTVCTEESPTNPLSIYANTKLQVEELLTASYRDESIIYRFSTAYGLSGLMRTNLLLNDLAYKAVKGEDLTIFQADFKRSFVHTSDIAFSIMAAIENFDKMVGKIYNVGHPQGNWTKRDAAEYIKKLTNCRVHYAENGYVDPDQRDYEISFEKIKPFWEASISMETGMSELIKGLKTLHEPSKFR